MRIWPLSSHPKSSSGNGLAQASGLLASLVSHLGQHRFAQAALKEFNLIVPAASWSVYRIGHHQPLLYMSAANGIPDTTQQCWKAYLTGPQHEDQSWGADARQPLAERCSRGPSMVHVQANEVSHCHRAQVYEAHGMAERISIAEPAADGSVFAVNFYRHQHQKPFTDGHLNDFADLSAALLALTQKHIDLMHSGSDRDTPDTRQSPGTDFGNAQLWQQRLLKLNQGLTPRELQVCLRLLQGMTQDGVAADLGLSPPTVKTYRNRAFARLGIQYRNQLFALVLGGR